MRINPEPGFRAVAAEMMDNMSVSDQSELSPFEIQAKKNAKLRKIARNGMMINRKSTATLIGIGCFINLLIGLSPLLYTSIINTGVGYCTQFSSALSGDLQLSAISSLTQTQA